MSYPKRIRTKILQLELECENLKREVIHQENCLPSPIAIRFILPGTLAFNIYQHSLTKLASTKKKLDRRIRQLKQLQELA